MYVVSTSWKIMLQWTQECRYLFEILTSLPLDKYSSVELQYHAVVLFSISWNCFTFPPTEHKGSVYSTSSPTLVTSCHFNNDHSNRCVVVSLCGLDLHSLMIRDVEHLFMCLLPTWRSSFEKCLFRPFAHCLIRFFRVLLLSCKNALCILCSNCFSYPWWTNVSSCFMAAFSRGWSPPMLCRSSFVCWVSLVCFCFCCLCFWCQPPKSLPTPVSKSLLRRFFLRVLCFPILCTSF